MWLNDALINGCWGGGEDSIIRGGDWGNPVGNGIGFRECASVPSKGKKFCCGGLNEVFGARC